MPGEYRINTIAHILVGEKLRKGKRNDKDWENQTRQKHKKTNQGKADVYQ